MNNHKKLMMQDRDGDQIQVLPETDVAAVIGLEDRLHDMENRIDELERALGRTTNHFLYHS